MALVDSYVENVDEVEKVEGANKRVVLQLSPKLAPYKIAVFPLLRNKPELVEKAKGIYEMLKNKINGKVVWDDRGNIGKRYLYQDEIGTPWCVTVDFETLEDEAVTIRHRDSAKQERVKIEDIADFVSERLK